MTAGAEDGGRAAEPFALRGAHITLDALLKACGLAGSGGAAKGLIARGAVQVNGQPETRRGRKLRPGDEVALGGRRLRVTAGPPA
ncbi:MAG: RNA-binding S4 domain-containing protein, partial [Burkholderiales bacterium]|nr:RNA-binding S4 domain-containing protein [Burkholderiales bacterium]